MKILIVNSWTPRGVDEVRVSSTCELELNESASNSDLITAVAASQCLRTDNITIVVAGRKLPFSGESLTESGLREDFALLRCSGRPIYGMVDVNMVEVWLAGVAGLPPPGVFVEEPIDVLVTAVDGETWSFRVCPSTLIEDLKQQVQDVSGLDPTGLELVSGSRVLEGSTSVGKVAELMESLELAVIVVVMQRPWAGCFDHKASQWQIGTTGGLFSNRSFTVATWIKIHTWNSDHQADNAILGTKDYCSGWGLHLILRNRQPILGFYCNDTTAPTKLELNRWTHLAFVYDIEAREQRIFVSGELAALGRGKAPLQGNLGVFVGTWAFGGRWLNGEMLRLDIWSVPRSATEVLEDFGARMAAAQGPMPNGLVQSWRWLAEDEATFLCDAVSGDRIRCGGNVVRVMDFV